MSASIGSAEGNTPGGNIMSSIDIVAMQNEVQEWIKAKGWNDDRTFGDEIALLISEPIEALEAFRDHGLNEFWSIQPRINGTKMPKMSMVQWKALKEDLLAHGMSSNLLEEPAPRREGVAAEFAGTLVRLLDDCARHNIDLGAEFRKEMDYNWTRAHRHGGKAL